MALSIFLIGGVAIIVVIAFLFFVNVVRSGVVADGGPDAGPHHNALGMGCFARAKKSVLLLLGCSKSLGTTMLHDFPPSVYKPR